ncbi:hypothetical protein Ahia01_000708600 [Argonauta hians]
MDVVDEGTTNSNTNTNHNSNIHNITALLAERSISNSSQHNTITTLDNNTDTNNTTTHINRNTTNSLVWTTNNNNQGECSLYTSSCLPICLNSIPVSNKSTIIADTDHTDIHRDCNEEILGSNTSDDSQQLSPPQPSSLSSLSQWLTSDCKWDCLAEKSSLFVSRNFLTSYLLKSSFVYLVK